MVPGQKIVVEHQDIVAPGDEFVCGLRSCSTAGKISRSQGELFFIVPAFSSVVACCARRASTDCLWLRELFVSCPQCSKHARHVSPKHVSKSAAQHNITELVDDTLAWLIVYTFVPIVLCVFAGITPSFTVWVWAFVFDQADGKPERTLRTFFRSLRPPNLALKNSEGSRPHYSLRTHFAELEFGIVLHCLTAGIEAVLHQRGQRFRRFHMEERFLSIRCDWRGGIFTDVPSCSGCFFRRFCGTVACGGRSPLAL